MEQGLGDDLTRPLLLRSREENLKDSVIQGQRSGSPRSSNECISVFVAEAEAEDATPSGSLGWNFAPPSKLEILEGLESGTSIGNLQTDAQTVFNMMNLYVGVGLLSLGYAVKLGGWINLGLLAMFGAILSYSAKMLCRSFTRLSGSTVPSYPDLGHRVFGPSGQWMIMLTGGADIFGAMCLSLIIVWQSLEMLLPASPLCLRRVCFTPSQTATFGSTIFLLPAVLIRTFSRLTSISVSGVISSLLLTSGASAKFFALVVYAPYASIEPVMDHVSHMLSVPCKRPVVVITYATDPERKLAPPLSEVHHAVDWTHLPMAAGIMLVSLSGHVGLPSLQRSMMNPENFERCVSIAFSCMICIYAIMGGVAYLYFGEATQVLITANLTQASSVTGFIIFKIGTFSISIDQAMTALVALSAYTTIPAMVYVIAELLVDIARGEPSHHAPGVTDLIVRVIVLSSGFLVAITALSTLFLLCHHPFHFGHFADFSGMKQKTVPKNFMTVNTKDVLPDLRTRYNVLANVESIMGGVSSACISLLLPSLIYLKLYEEDLSIRRKALAFGMVVLGAIAIIITTAVNLLELRSIS